MKLNFIAGKTKTKHEEASLDKATHFTCRPDGDIMPLHSIVDRTNAATKVHRRNLACHGIEYPVDECRLLKAVSTQTPDSYVITLTGEEAKVLAEVLRYTRAGDNPHEDVRSVCSELWGLLPPSSAVRVTGSPIHVSKSA